MRLSIVDGRANSDIEWAGGIWRVIEDSGMPVYGEDDRGGKGEGLAARGGVDADWSVNTAEENAGRYI
jgi:hypothetical protein